MLFLLLGFLHHGGVQVRTQRLRQLRTPLGGALFQLFCRSQFGDAILVIIVLSYAFSVCFN